ncbi:hypothetical protein CLU79DRAFT_517335 [Phycomyces nitens]|nr:hypothetical protein CLU79DRAFT_517335 [Phycomyces nitens]
MQSQAYASVVYAAVYMIILYFIVHYIVLNLFIAVIIENFELDEDEIREIQIKKYIRHHRWQPEYYQIDSISQFLLPFFVAKKNPRLHIKDMPHHLVLPLNKDRFKLFYTKEYIQNSDAEEKGFCKNERTKEQRRSSTYLAKAIERKSSVV